MSLNSQHTETVMKRCYRESSCLLAFAAIIAVGAWTGIPGLQAASPDEAAPSTPAELYQALLKEFSAASRIIWEPTTDLERSNAIARVDKLPLKLLELAEKNPKDTNALDALIQVVNMEYWLNTHTSHPGWGNESRQAMAISAMLRDHLDSDKLGEACRRVHYCFRAECETFLRTVLAKSPHREVQAAACLRLAEFLLNRMDRLDVIKDQPEQTTRYELLYGKDYLQTLRQQDRTKVIAEAAALYEQASAKYGDVKMPYSGTVGETAQTELYDLRYLAVGKEAPDMEGVDQDSRPFKLSDYRGKVVLLYFWSEF